MKVKELRDLLKDKDIKLINDAFVEVYKALPKAKKEEINVDIESILSGEGKKKAKKQENIPLPDLFNEIATLINYAYQGYYISPNRVVPKKDRPKWRFQVKRYLKALFKVSSQDPNFPKVVQYIEELYKMLTYGCGVYIFQVMIHLLQ